MSIRHRREAIIDQYTTVPFNVIKKGSRGYEKMIAFIVSRVRERDRLRESLNTKSHSSRWDTIEEIDEIAREIATGMVELEPVNKRAC